MGWVGGVLSLGKEMLHLPPSPFWLPLPGAEPEKFLGTFPCLLESMASSLMDICKDTWADVIAHGAMEKVTLAALYAGV